VLQKAAEKQKPIKPLKKDGRQAPKGLNTLIAEREKSAHPRTKIPLSPLAIHPKVPQ